MERTMTTYTFRTRPYKHQVKALKKVLRNGRGALLMEMGTGKSKVAIDWVAATAVRRNPRAPAIRALVVCPLVVMGTWHKEIAKHDPFADNDLVGVDWRIINYDKMWRPHYYDELVEWMEERLPTLLIFDESHKIKTPSARRSQAAHRLARHAAGVLVMSGTPMTRGPIDLFSQYKAVDPSIFGDNFRPFKKRYAVWENKGGYEVLARYRRMKELRTKIAPITFHIKKQDCLDLPSRNHKVVPIELPPRAHKVYSAMARQAVAEWNGVESVAPIVLTRLLRLQQITGGYLHGDDGVAALHTARKDALREYLLDMREQGIGKVGICCRFIPELRDIANVAHDAGYKVLVVYGKVPPAKRDRIFSAFEATDQPVVFACQIQTGALGRNELVVAHEAISYSLTYSLDDFYQWLDRYHRPGQRHNVTYHHFVVPDSVDEAVLLALQTKRQVADLVLAHPELIGVEKEEQ
jgi:SNF2 family DNA or RNA helicase